jgi:hypothetical protein
LEGKSGGKKTQYNKKHQNYRLAKLFKIDDNMCSIISAGCKKLALFDGTKIFAGLSIITNFTTPIAVGLCCTKCIYLPRYYFVLVEGLAGEGNLKHEIDPRFFWLKMLYPWLANP